MYAVWGWDKVVVGLNTTGWQRRHARGQYHKKASNANLTRKQTPLHTLVSVEKVAPVMKLWISWGTSTPLCGCALRQQSSHQHNARGSRHETLDCKHKPVGAVTVVALHTIPVCRARHHQPAKST